MKKIALSLSLLLTACAVGPDYHLPDISLPSSWVSPAKETVVDDKAAVEQEWWKHFGDSTLDQLISKADSSNFDLKIAETRIAQSRAGLSAAKAGLLPKGDFGTTDERQSNRIAFPGGSIPFDLSKPFNTFQVGFDASWEIDLFGLQRRDIEAERANYQASVASRDDARVSLLAEVARTYVSIRQYQQQIVIAQSTINADKKTFDLTNQRFAAGQVPGLDVTQAKAQMEQAQAQLPHDQDMLAQSEFAMDVLIGEQPGATQKMVQDAAPIPSFNGKLVLAAPAAVVAERPDIRIAERQLAEATAQQGIAVAKFFPDVSISGFLGVLSTDSSHLLTYGNKSWSETGNVMLPILNYGTLSANLDAADAKQQEAMANYQKTILAALSDVERAVTDYQTGEMHRDSLQQTAADDGHAVAIARQRYQEGQSSFLELLDAQRVYYTAQSQQADADAMSAQNLVAVYKSFGGGWK